MVKSYI